jgi:hypothetical protein
MHVIDDRADPVRQRYRSARAGHVRHSAHREHQEAVPPTRWPIHGAGGRQQPPAQAPSSKDLSEKNP